MCKAYGFRACLRGIHLMQSESKHLDINIWLHHVSLYCSTLLCSFACIHIDEWKLSATKKGGKMENNTSGDVCVCVCRRRWARWAVRYSLQAHAFVIYCRWKIMPAPWCSEARLFLASHHTPGCPFGAKTTHRSWRVRWTNKKWTTNINFADELRSRASRSSSERRNDTVNMY